MDRRPFGSVQLVQSSCTNICEVWRTCPPLSGLIALTLLLLSLAPPAATAVPTGADRTALEALYTATDGPNWTDNTNWLSTAPLGDWYGVTTDSDGQVTELNLSNNNLIGSIPAELRNLVNLDQLYLRLNALSGSIPAELGQLTNLRRLNLNYNALSGSIPAELGQLTNLQYLYLQGNALSGPIPAEVGRLTQLQLLDLHNNDLSGPIPAEVSALAALKDLKLYNNAALSGPIPDSFLGSLPSLREVEIQNTQVTVPETAAFQMWKDSIETFTEGTQTHTASIALALANASPTGLWSDGTTLWVADVGTAKVYAYSLATGAPASDKSIVLPSSNAAPRGLWSDGETLWVTDSADDRVYAYSLADGSRAKVKASLLAPANIFPRDLWSDGGTLWVVDSALWVADSAAVMLYAYSLETALLVGALEKPGPDSFQGGIGVLSGWVCEGVTVTIEINGSAHAAAYGTARADTAERCGDTNNGFGLLFNWNLLGDGEYTVVALADGVEFGRATVTVTTLGEEFVRGVSGETQVVDFPDPGTEVRLVWQEGVQNFMLAPPEGIPTTRLGKPIHPRRFLENPGPDSFQSGVGVLSGWVCEAEEVVLEVNGQPWRAAYGTARADTAAVCGDSDNGFGLLFNWNLLSDGTYTVVALADDAEFGRATFTVTTLGEEFLQDVVGETVVVDFPSPGETVRLVWQEAGQNFVLAPLPESSAGQ